MPKTYFVEEIIWARVKHPQFLMVSKHKLKDKIIFFFAVFSLVKKQNLT